MEKTNVRGLVMDQEPNYIEHGKEINRKIHFRWVSICIPYAYIIWINNRSIKVVEKVWYKMLMSVIGAVFHIRQSLAEVIVGIPPISVANEVKSTKHSSKQRN